MISKSTWKMYRNILLLVCVYVERRSARVNCLILNEQITKTLGQKTLPDLGVKLTSCYSKTAIYYLVRVHRGYQLYVILSWYEILNKLTRCKVSQTNISNSPRRDNKITFSKGIYSEVEARGFTLIKPLFKPNFHNFLISPVMKIDKLSRTFCINYPSLVTCVWWIIILWTFQSE